MKIAYPSVHLEVDAKIHEVKYAFKEFVKSIYLLPPPI